MSLNSSTIPPSKLITDIPEVPMLYLFDLLPLQELFQVGQVCVRFRELQQRAFFTRRSITVWLEHQCAHSGSVMATFSVPFVNQLTNSDGTRMIPMASVSQLSGRFYYKDWIYLTSASVKSLCRNLPNVRSLEVFIVWPLVPKFDLLLDLLKHCSPTLVTLQVWTQFPVYIGSLSMHQRSFVQGQALLQSIQSLPKLRNLTLDLLKGHIYKFDMPILPQLESFYFCSSNRIKLHTLRQYAQAGHIRQIGLDNQINDSNYRKMLKLVPQFAATFTYLNVRLDERKLKRIFGHFVNLTSLSLDTMNETFAAMPVTFSMSTLATLLTSLKSLVHLSVCFNQPLLDSSEPIPQLNQIKVLTIYLSGSLARHTALECLQLLWTFPGVVALKIWDWRAFDCKECHSTSTYCRAKLLQPLKNWSTLKRIEVYDDEDRLVVHKLSQL